MENSLFSSILHFFLIGLFGFLVVKFLCSLYVMDISPLTDVGLVKIFFPICRLLISTIDYAPDLQKLFSSMRSNLSILDPRPREPLEFRLGNVCLCQ